MPGAAGLLVVAFAFGIVGELPAAGIVLAGAIVFGAIELAAMPKEIPPRFRDRYHVDDVRPVERSRLDLDDFLDVRRELSRQLDDE